MDAAMSAFDPKRTLLTLDILRTLKEISAGETVWLKWLKTVSIAG